jgi:hypothetical protein
MVTLHNDYTHVCDRLKVNSLNTSNLTSTEQDRHYTYDVISRRVHETIAVVEKQYTFLCVCGWVGARARACTFARVTLLIQHATRRHIAICGLQAPQRHGFQKKLLNIKCVI